MNDRMTPANMVSVEEITNITIAYFKLLKVYAMIDKHITIKLHVRITHNLFLVDMAEFDE